MVAVLLEPDAPKFRTLMASALIAASVRAVVDPVAVTVQPFKLDPDAQPKPPPPPLETS